MVNENNDQPQETWQSVSEAFSSLGSKFREHYKAVGEAGPNDEQVKEAFRTLGAAWDRVVDAVGNAFRDPELREQVRATGTAVAKAVGDKLGEAGREIKKTVSRAEREMGEGEAAPGPEEDATADAFEPSPVDPGAEEPGEGSA